MLYLLEILGICAYLVKEPPFVLYLAKVFLAFMSFTPIFDHPVFMEYSSDGLVATE